VQAKAEAKAEAKAIRVGRGEGLVEMGMRSAAEVSRAELEARERGAAVVEICGQVYQLRGTDPAHIERLAGVVDAKMRAVSAHGATVDSLRVAVLAALNIADELLALRGRYEALSTSVILAQGSEAQAMQASMRTRAGSLMGMLDEVLEQRKAG
jgi:cell division protein ZapA